MNTSYHERTHWIEGVVSTLALLYYFLKVSGLEGGLNGDSETVLYLVVKTTVMAVVAIIVLVSINAGMAKKEETVKDERDTQIELMGFRNGYYVCSGLLTVVFVGALLNERMLQGDMKGTGISTINYLVHALFFAGWMASVVQSMTHVFFYRRGLV